MTTVHDWNRAEDIGPRIIAAFFEGKSVREIANASGKTDGVVSGVLSRARCARYLLPGREVETFVACESQAFAIVVKEGKSPEAAAIALGKSPKAGVLHARGLGLLAKRKVSPVAREAALADKALATPKVAVSPVETTPRRVDDTPEDKVQRACDARLVAALIAEGGFNRYDDTFDWLLNMHGARIAAVSPAAKADLAARRARLASAA